MLAIFKKEIHQFFSSITGYLAVILFLLANGLFLFVFPETSLLDAGYANLDGLFELAPMIFLLLDTRYYHAEPGGRVQNRHHGTAQH